MLSLGAVQFQGFEIPEELNLGGKQTLVVHKLIGGQRVIAAMGPDPDDIRWQGRFQGGDAVGRAQQLDAMRDAGAPVVLLCGSITLNVVISEFTWRYQREYQALYSICCVVIPDATTVDDQSLDDLVGADYTAASNIASGAAGI